MKAPTTLLSLSGGIDSVACLYWWLRERPDQPLLCHHIRLRSRRMEREGAAVDAVVEWLHKRGMTNFTVLKSDFAFGSVGCCVRDTELVSMFAGIVLNSRHGRSVHQLIQTTPLDEYERLGASAIAGITERRQLLATNLARRPVRLFNPLRRMRKVDVIANIPKELFELCWYCRSPQPDGSTCGKCHTCIQVAPFFNQSNQGKHNEHIKPVYPTTKN